MVALSGISPNFRHGGQTTANSIDMKYLAVVFPMLFSFLLPAQQVVDRSIPSEGMISLSEQIAIPKVDRGYTLWLPDSGPIAGMVVFTHPRRDTTGRDTLIDYALSRQLAVLYATTENRLEFFFESERMQEIEEYIHEAIATYRIPADRLLYCGMSLEGTRALKLAIFGQSAQSAHRLKPKAIALCDAPLDMVRFHREMVKSRELHFHPIAANEGAWVSDYLERNLGGSPAENLSAYLQYSPYSYTAGGSPDLRLLRDIAIRAYTEPDVNWWIETRRKDYYGMNAIDLAALVNELRILGNERAELIVTRAKGKLPDGTRHPHSWSIVDEKELIDWFLAL